MHYLTFLLSFLFPVLQTPADSLTYSVAYVEVLPSAKAAAVTAFKQYRDASRKDEGYMRAELLEQLGRPGHFAVIETWSNLKQLESHIAEAHTKQFLSQLEPIRTSDYDQRPYRGLTVSPPVTASNKSVFVVTHVDTVGQQSNAPELLRNLADASRKDPGNV